MIDPLRLETGLESVFGDGRQSAELFAGGRWQREPRHWSQMREYFTGHPASGDPLIYETFMWPAGRGATDMLLVFTALHPGQIGAEHHHTKGHFHDRPDGPEFVICYAGKGTLETAPRGGRVRSTAMAGGVHARVPDGHAHRMINTGVDALIFLSICSAGVGHDYQSVAEFRWRRRGV